MVGEALLATVLGLQGFAAPRTTAKQQTELISLARRAVKSAVLHEVMPIPVETADAKPVFVTIEIHGAVRGCRGDLAVRTASLQNEVIRAAADASAHDPRYRPLQPADLKAFQVTVTVVYREEPLDEVSSLRPEEGLVLRSGGKTGVVLPFEGRDATTRLQWAFRKAGAPIGSPARLTRLIGERFRG